jgi:multidrug efflux pump subunit AcrA (membrane-fusion protein)
VRVRIPSSPDGPAPGASVRVEIPAGPSVTAVAVPVNALRKGPEGDHVFVITTGADGKPRAHVRAVESGPVVGDDILIVGGLVPGERVATSGSFKLREAVLVAVAPGTVAAAPEGSR